ncbi:MAG: transcription termination factor NusA [Dehalococcoidia bacterium]
MKNEFLMAITQLAAEKHLPREVILGAIESALVSAYRKDDFAAPTQNISVQINPVNGDVKVLVDKLIQENVTDPRREISLAEAQKLKAESQIDETIEVEATPQHAGRIAAQTAKQVVLQRLREAEHDAIFEEFRGKEGDVLSGVVSRIEPRQIFVNLGRTEAVLPNTEQVRNERYRTGQRLKVYVVEVQRTPRGPQIIVSRTHRDMLRRLLEMEIPEVFNGTVEVKSLAREPGFRSKVAVVARQEGVDPVGCCVGLRGIRIQNVVHELNGEKIDVVLWDANPTRFIANALSPAQVLSVEIDEEEKATTVVVPDRQLSLAIGKEGQNARLAAKLTGWRIDIKSASSTEEKAPAEEAPEGELAAAVAGTAVEAPAAQVETPAAQVASEVPAAKEAVEAPAAKEAVVTPAAKEAVATPEPVAKAAEAEAELAPLPDVEDLVPQEVEVVAPQFSIDEIDFHQRKPAEKSQIRFAEDVLGPRRGRPEGKNKKGAKGAKGKKGKKKDQPQTAAPDAALAARPRPSQDQAAPEIDTEELVPAATATDTDTDTDTE